MKIAGYSPMVDSNGASRMNGVVRVSGDPMAYGGDGSGYRALGKALGEIQAVIEKQQEDQDKENILNAVNAYNAGRFDIMYNENNGLMNTQLDGSQGISEGYMQAEKKLRANVLSGVKLHNNRNMVALNNMLDSSAMQGYESVYQHQTKQLRAASEARYGDYMNKQIEFAQSNYDNVASVNELLKQSDLMTDLQYSKYGGEVLVKAKQQEARATIISNAMSAAISHEDYATARELKDAFGSSMNNKERLAFESVLYKKEQANFDYKLGQELFQKYGKDEAAVRAALQQTSAFTEPLTDFDSLVRAIGGQESGGNYEAKNARTRASGKYQIMPENWPSWAEEAGIGKNAEQTPENQETVARYKLKQYYDKYGARGAAIAWYAGEGAVAYGTDALNRKQGNGDEPSINEYADSVLERMEGGRTPKTMSLDEQNRVFQQYEVARNAAERQKRYADSQTFDNAKNQLFQMLNGNVPAEQAWKWVQEQSGSNEPKYEILRNAFSTIYGGARGASGANGGSGKSIGSTGRAALLDQLRANPYLQNKADFLTYARRMGATNADLDALDKEYDNFLKGTGVFKYDFDGMAQGIVGNTIKSEDGRKQILKGLDNVGKMFVRKFRADHNGFDPDESLVRDAMAESLTKKAYGSYVSDYGRLWNSNTPLSLSKAQLASVGIAEIISIGKDRYEVRYMDGRVGGTVTGEYLDRIAGGKK